MLPRPDTFLRQALKQRLQVYALEEIEIPALMGDANGVVLVPNPGDDPTLRQSVYVRINGVAVIAFNDQVPNIPDLEVFVARHPTQPQMLRVKRVRNVEDLPYATNVDRHAKSHIYMHEDGGDDVVWVDLRQYMPLRVSIVTGMKIHIYRAIVLTQTGYTVVGGEFYDLSSYLPNAGEARFVLITVSNTGQIVFTVGATITGPRSSLTLANIPSLPTNHFAVAAVALEGGQTSLVENRIQSDIVDLRAFSGGGSLPTGTPGAVLFFDSGGNIGSDAANLFYDNSTGTLFIGSNVPYDNFPFEGRKLHMTSPDSRSLFAEFVVYHNSAQGANYLTGRRARGTRAAPTPVQENDYLFVLGAQGYGGLTPNWLGPPSFIAFVSNDNWGNGVFGQRLEIWLVPKGDTTAQRAFVIDQVLLKDSMIRIDEAGNLSSGLSADVEEYVRFMG